MSFFGFILRALALTPIVFLRYLPVLAVYLLIFVGLWLSTDNPWVLGMVSFIMLTVGLTFVYITGMRGALMAIGATTAPTAEKLLEVTTRVMFAHLLPQLLLVFALTAGLYMAAGYVLFPAVLQDTPNIIVETVSVLGSDDTQELEAYAELMAGLEPSTIQLQTALSALCFHLAVAFGLGIFGIPMAATAANAVQYSPGNDLIFGIGRFFPQQVIIYLLASALPNVALTLTMPTEMFMSGVDPLAPNLWTIGFAIVLFVSPCASFAAMALGYDVIRARLARARQAERVPELDYEAERDKLKSLRQVRTEERSRNTVYDPVAEARAHRLRMAAGDQYDDEDYDDTYDDEDDPDGAQDPDDRRQ